MSVLKAIFTSIFNTFQAERAHMLASEAIEKGLQLSTSVYNSLLACVGFLREGTQMRIEALKSTLAQMNEQVRIQVLKY